MAPDERRQAIIDATLPLLLEHGPDISTREIARAASVAEGTIFRAFETKQDLIHATIHAAMQPDAAIATIAALPDGQSLNERVEAILEVLRSEIVRTRSVFAHFARPAMPPHPPTGPHDQRAPGPHNSKARLGRAVAASLAPYAGHLSVSTDFAARVLMALSFAASFTLTEETVFSAAELAEVVLHGIAGGAS